MDISLIINDKDVPAVVEVINDLKDTLQAKKNNCQRKYWKSRCDWCRYQK